MSLSLAYTFTRTHMHTGIRTRTCTEVSVFDKARVEVLAPSAQLHHIMGNPFSSSDPQSALITTSCSKALNPCVTTRCFCVRDQL